MCDPDHVQRGSRRAAAFALQQAEGTSSSTALSNAQRKPSGNDDNSTHIAIFNSEHEVTQRIDTLTGSTAANRPPTATFHEATSVSQLTAKYLVKAGDTRVRY